MNAQTTARTAGPWSVYETGTGIFLEYSESRRVIAKVGGPHDNAQDKANAAFIVQACNAHDDLVAALRKFEAHYPTGINPFLDEAANMGRAALQKVAS